MPSCCPWSALHGLPGPCPARRQFAPGTRPTALSGTARLDVRVTAQGGSVAASLVRVRGLCGPGGPLPPLELELRVGLVPYDASFSRELLESRYRELYSCLSHNAEAFMTV